MRKKRFLRRVMAYGVQRNEAQEMARRVAEFGTYEALLEHYRFTLSFRPAVLAFRRIGKNVRKAARVFMSAAEALFCGVDLSSNGSFSVTVHHPAGGLPAPTHTAGNMAALTQEEHRAANAAERSV